MKTPGKKRSLKSLIRSAFLYVAPTLLLLLFLVYLIFHFNQENKRLTDDIRAGAPGKFLLLENGNVHYRLEGSEDDPLIIFVHGGGVTGEEVWKKNIPFFVQKGFRVLSFDLYGRGYSDRPKEPHNPELFLKQTEQLIEKLGIKEPFYLVALSMGAMIGLDYAYAHPNQIKKLVLIDPAAAGTYKLNPVMHVPVLSNFIMTVMWYPKAIENQRKEFVSNEEFEEYADRLAYFMDFKGYKQSNFSTWKNMLNKSKIHLVEAIPSSKLLLIYGDKDPYFREGQKQQFLDRLPSLRFTKVNEAGHMPNYEKPEEVNQIVYDFLSSSSSLDHQTGG